jgi:hypothetical protein
MQLPGQQQDGSGHHRSQQPNTLFQVYVLVQGPAAGSGRAHTPMDVQQAAVGDPRQLLWVQQAVCDWQRQVQQQQQPPGSLDTATYQTVPPVKRSSSPAGNSALACTFDRGAATSSICGSPGGLMVGCTGSAQPVQPRLMSHGVWASWTWLCTACVSHRQQARRTAAAAAGCAAAWTLQQPAHILFCACSSSQLVPRIPPWDTGAALRSTYAQ